jgi:endonuclease-3
MAPKTIKRSASAAQKGKPTPVKARKVRVKVDIKATHETANGASPQWTTAEVAEAFRRFAAANPHPHTELHYTNPFTLLVAVVLSAQATDAGVNKATPALFKLADTPAKMAKLGEVRVRDLIKTIGLYRTKAKNVVALSHQLVAQHGGEVPRDRDALEALPGVGRKTANVVLNVAFGEPTIAVDTHIFRVGNRTGLAVGKTPLDVEMKLLEVVPARYLPNAHHWLILHGRYTCVARRPLCEKCIIADLCKWPGKTINVPSALSAGATLNSGKNKMELIKAKVRQKKNIYIHNDLSNAADFFKRAIEEKTKNNERDGLGFYRMACALMLAFTFEAKINFLGHKLVLNWKEQQNFDDKVGQVLARLGINADWKVRPYSSIEGLRQFRNSIAHGKPVEITHDETIQVPEEELDRRVDLSGTWEAACTLEKLIEASDDVDNIWKDLLKRSGLSVWDTLTTGVGGITFIEKVTVTNPT